MKKLIFLVLSLGLITNAIGQVKPVRGNLPDTQWGKHNHPHVVPLGSTFEYQVRRDTTFTLEMLKELIANKLNGKVGLNKEHVANANRFVWELYKVTYDATKDEYSAPTAVTGFDEYGADEDARFTKATESSNLDMYKKTYSWKEGTPANFVSDDYYLVRVSEYANHFNDVNESSKLADKQSKVVSELIVKIGEKLQIYLPDTGETIDRDGNVIAGSVVNNDYFVCISDLPVDAANALDKAKSLEYIDNHAGMIKFNFNARPRQIEEAFFDGYQIKLELTETIAGYTIDEHTLPDGTVVPASVVDGSIKTTEVIVKIPLVECKPFVAGDATTNKNLTYDPTNGYYSYTFGLVELQALQALDIDATNSDRFYEVKVLSYRHGDSEGDGTDADLHWTKPDLAADKKNKKDMRIYGIYTRPVITKINHK